MTPPRNPQQERDDDDRDKEETQREQPSTTRYAGARTEQPLVSKNDRLDER